MSGPTTDPEVLRVLADIQGMLKQLLAQRSEKIVKNGKRRATRRRKLREESLAQTEQPQERHFAHARTLLARGK